MATGHIERVVGRKREGAIRFLIAGMRDDDIVEAQVNAFARQTIDRYPHACQLWWARHWGRTLAAAMVFENVGKTGLVFASPIDAPGVERANLVELLRTAAGQAVEGGLSMVQSLLPAEATQDACVLQDAGFMLLTELIYMRLGLPMVAKSAAPDSEWVWRTVEQESEALLGEVILRTYQQSLDCPRLEGVRQVADVIAGHRASGVYRPQSWWIAFAENKPAGCLLLNETATGDAADVVYLGVAPEFRGQGLGRALLSRAIATARSRGMGAVTLAVDAQNTPAVRLYASAGFQETQKRAAYVLTWKMMAGKGKAGE